MRAEAGGIKWDALRKRLVRARTIAPLFRTAEFTQDFESVVQQVLHAALEEQSGQTLPQTGSVADTIPAAPKTKSKKKTKKTKKKSKKKGK
jgi:hypothetical protein